MKILRELRENKGLTLEQVAEALGLRNQYISNYELGKRRPDYDTLAKLADFYGVTVDYLLGREQKKAPTQEGERQISDDDIKFALWGTREIDDDVLDRVRQFAKFAQENEKNK